MTALLIIAWLVTGYASFVYWWIKDFDFCVNDAIFAIIPALIGPTWFFMGWCIHGDRIDKPLIKQRGVKK